MSASVYYMDNGGIASACLSRNPYIYRPFQWLWFTAVFHFRSFELPEHLLFQGSISEVNRKRLLKAHLASSVPQDIPAPPLRWGTPSRWFFLIRGVFRCLSCRLLSFSALLGSRASAPTIYWPAVCGLFRRFASHLAKCQLTVVLHCVLGHHYLLVVPWRKKLVFPNKWIDIFNENFSKMK